MRFARASSRASTPAKPWRLGRPVSASSVPAAAAPCESQSRAACTACAATAATSAASLDRVLVARGVDHQAAQDASGADQRDHGAAVVDGHLGIGQRQRRRAVAVRQLQRRAVVGQHVGGGAVRAERARGGGARRGQHRPQLEPRAQRLGQLRQIAVGPGHRSPRDPAGADQHPHRGALAGHGVDVQPAAEDRGPLVHRGHAVVGQAVVRLAHHAAAVVGDRAPPGRPRPSRRSDTRIVLQPACLRAFCMASRTIWNRCT